MSLLDIGEKLKGLFSGASNFVKQNPTPASFVGKQIQPLQQFLQQGTQKIQGQLNNNFNSSQALQKQGVYGGQGISPIRAVITDFQPQIQSALGKLPTLNWGVGNPIQPKGIPVKTGNIVNAGLNLLTGGGYSPEQQSYIKKINAGSTKFTPQDIATGKQLQQEDMLNVGGILAGPTAKNFPKSGMGTFSALTDKKPRFEINDNLAKLKVNTWDKLMKIVGSDAKVTDVIDHPTLFKQYPELKDYKIKFSTVGNYGGQFDPNTKTISVSWDLRVRKPEEIKSTLLHEIQHAIQEREGFARGGSPALFGNNSNDANLKDLFNRQWDYVNSLEQGSKKWSLANDELQRIAKELNTPKQNYQRLAGEVEARDVSARMDLTPQQRVNNPPYRSQGIPVKDQIVRFDGGVSASKDVTKGRLTYEGKAKENLPYIAGLIDGEGHIRLTPAKNGQGRSYYRPDIIVAQKDRKILDELMSLYGGRIDKQVRPNWDKTGTSEMHYWRLSGRKAVELAKEIEPMLRVKSEQAKRLTALNYDEGGRMMKSTIPDLSVVQPSRLQKAQSSTPPSTGGEMVYHGTSPQRAEIIKKEGFSINPKQETSTLGKGIYFANEKGYSELFSKGGDSSIVQAKLKPNLKIFDVKTSDDFVALLGKDTNGGNPDAITKKFQKLGYDGIRREGELVIFDPKNVTSSGGEIGGVTQVKPLYKIKQKELPKKTASLQPQKDLIESPSSEPIISPNVYNAEPTTKTQNAIKIKGDKAVQSTKDRDFKEWSSMIFKQEGASVKNKEKALVDTIGRSIEQNTERATAQRILRDKTVVARDLSRAQSEAKTSFVTNQKGRVVTSKGGSPVDRDVVVRAQSWKDKPRLSYARETMTRNFEDIMGKDASDMKARYLEPVQKAETNRVRWLNKERSEIKSLGIAPRSEESKLVQQLGEGLITKDKLGPNAQKIIKAEAVLRSKYDRYITEINTVLQRNGYDPIPKRKDYFRHFTEVNGMLEQFGIPVRDNTLPTDINGLSADFRPGKNFFTSALQRKGDITDYDAIQGIDQYIDGASKQIFHTDNIQNLRLLDKSLRETYAGTTHLSNFVADLTEYTNTLSGKKAMIDRSIESALGRGIYGLTDKLRRQAGSNMVGANVASAMTNYIPLTQSLATTDKPSFIKGMMQTIASTFKDDGFVNRSDFLTRRLGSDRLSTNLWGKIGDKSMWLMKTVDNFTSGTIVRSKYAEGMKRGLSPSQAMKRADEWAAKVLSDRSLGSMPTLFNSKTLGLLTQFQLEVNNQLSFMFKDIPRNYSTVGAASALGQVFLYSYLFNNLYEKAVGRRPAFDPIGVAQRTYEDYTNPDMKEGQATKNLIGNVSDQLPFTSILTGGRIPIGSAIPNPIAMATGDSTLSKEAKKLFYLLPPTGGGQIKKTIEGVKAFNQGASTSDSGLVRYPIPQTPVNAVRIAVAGQYSTPEARKYFREGTKTLGDKQSDVFKNSTNKEGTYKSFIDKRKESSQDDGAKEELKSSNQTVLEKNNKVYILQDNGDVRTIDPSFQPTKPVATGLSELDKKATSKFNGEITSKANDIYDLYKAGKMTQEEANNQLSALKVLKGSGSKKMKKLTFKKTPVKKFKYSMPKPVKMATLKIKAPPAPKLGKSRTIKLAKSKKIKIKKLKGLTVK